MHASLTDTYFQLSSVGARARRNNALWWLWFLGLTATAVLAGLLMFSRGTDVRLVVWFLYIAGAVAILYRARYGLYLVTFLTLVGDSALMPWFPFAKNFSSPESILYLHDALIVNPLETYLALTFISWLVRGATTRRLHFYRSELLLPALAFLGFVIFGLVYGIGTGGNVNIALWEARPIFYLIVLVVMTPNLLEKREHVSHLMWAAVLALLVEGIVGTWFYLVVLNRDLSSVQAITEHAAAIHMNSVIVLALAVWLDKSSATKRLMLPLLLPPILLTYLATQRRAAFVSLAIAFVFLAIFLFKEKRNLFWAIVPPLAVVGLAYTAAFWNAGGALGMPAQAIKSVIAPNQASAEDLSSNIYRQIENLNTGFTIRQKPLTGVGFGQKFYILVPLPDISFFEWWEYLPHNSIVWIWLKMGIGGFIAMLVFVGTGIMVGARTVIRMPRNGMTALALAALLYVIMHFVYAYVDISWDAQSMVYVGAMMGVLVSLERIVAQPVAVAPKRWPWQPEPEPVPGLREG